jgi:hypothetical protein
MNNPAAARLWNTRSEGADGMHSMSAAGSGDAAFGKSEVAYLALFDEFADRAGHILDRHLTIDAVLVKEVDMIGPQSLEAVSALAAVVLFGLVNLLQTLTPRAVSW